MEFFNKIAKFVRYMFDHILPITPLVHRVDYYYHDTAAIKIVLNILKCCKIIEIQLNNMEKIPTSGATLIACSHKHYFDIPIMTLFTNRVIRFLAKVELFKAYLVNRWFEFGGVIPIDRRGIGAESVKRCADVLDNYGLVGMFPEGTRNKGKGIKELFSGFTNIIMKCNVEVSVVPVVINYSRGKGCFGLPVKIVANCGDPIKVTKEDILPTEGEKTNLEAPLLKKLKRKKQADFAEKVRSAMMELVI